MPRRRNRRTRDRRPRPSSTPPPDVARSTRTACEPRSSLRRLLARRGPNAGRSKRLDRTSSSMSISGGASDWNGTTRAAISTEPTAATSAETIQAGDTDSRRPDHQPFQGSRSPRAAVSGDRRRRRDRERDAAAVSAARDDAVRVPLRRDRGPGGAASAASRCVPATASSRSTTRTRVGEQHHGASMRHRIGKTSIAVVLDDDHGRPRDRLRAAATRPATSTGTGRPPPSCSRRRRRTVAWKPVPRNASRSAGRAK